MKRITIYIISVLLTLSTLSASARKPKKVESSAKSAPAWINSLERGYIITTASEPTLEAAKQSVILGIKQQIAQSIVSNISVDLMQSSTTTEINGESSYNASVVDIIRSTTDKIPFLQAISLTKADDFYWEKYYNKKSGETHFDYYLKYAFSEQELNYLVTQFNAKQSEINNTIERMATEIETFTQIEDIDKNMNILRSLIAELAEGDPRIAKIDALNNRYRDQYKYISIEEIDRGEGYVILQPYLSGRIVETAQIPTHKSNGADRITKSVSKGTIEVKYDDYVCKAGDDNWIDITFRFGSNRVTHRINIIK